MKNTLHDVVKAAEDAGLDAQITIEDGVLCILAIERGPRREANDYFIHASITVHTDGTVGGFDRFAEDCKNFVTCGLPKAADKWFEFTWPAVGLRAVGNMCSWGFGTMEQAADYAAQHRINTTFAEVAGAPENDGATIVNLRRALERAA